MDESVLITALIVRMGICIILTEAVASHGSQALSCKLHRMQQYSSVAA